MTDLELIYAIKENNDSAAMTELATRHTGIFVNMVQRYTAYPDFTNRVNIDDLKENKMQYIFDWAKLYDPSRGMKFSSYVGDRTKHLCQNLLRRSSESVQLDERVSPTNDTAAIDRIEHDSDIAQIRHEAAGIPDSQFQRVFALRFAGNKVRSWRTIGREMGLSHEAARKIFNKHVTQMKKTLKT